MTRTGSADLPLHYGQVPPWLAQRMARLGRAVAETVVMDYGAAGLLARLSDPFWFQALGCVMGMDWHSSGITTSVMGALKKAIDPLSSDLGIFICGGRGKYSRQTPAELLRLGDRTGLDAPTLVRCSRLAAKVDNTAVQDGFQLYLHNFIVDRRGRWVVIQQGMNTEIRTARRYHWHSPTLRSFVEEPHAAVYGPNRGEILNLTHADAGPTRQGVLALTQGGFDLADLCALAARQGPATFGFRPAGSAPTTGGLCPTGPAPATAGLPHLIMPAHHDVRSSDINIKRLGAVLALAYEQPPMDFESLLLMEGVGPRTLQALTLVSEVIHGTPSRFSDPARFSFAHGGKDGHPFPVPLTVYDETLHQLETAVTRAKLGRSESAEALRTLSGLAASLEKDLIPEDRVEEWIDQERATSYRFGGMTVMGPATPPAATRAPRSGAMPAPRRGRPTPGQLALF